MSKPTLDELLSQARQGFEKETASADTANLQHNILASVANQAVVSPTTLIEKPEPQAQSRLWSWFTSGLYSPWRLGTAALLPLVIGFSLGSVDTLQSLEQLGEGYDTSEMLLVAEPTWNALLENNNE